MKYEFMVQPIYAGYTHQQSINAKIGIYRNTNQVFDLPGVFNTANHQLNHTKSSKLIMANLCQSLSF